MIGVLPEILTVCGEEYTIRSDYRNVLQVFEAFSDPELEPGEKWTVAIYLLFERFSCADDVEDAAREGFDVNEAARQITWFISVGKEAKKDRELPVYDWIQDEQMIFSAVNKVAGREVREVDYMHWWTLAGYLNGVDKEDIWTFIVGIRDKLNRGKKLEKHEREFYQKNRDLVDIKPPKTEEELQQEAERREIIDEVL